MSATTRSYPHDNLLRECKRLGNAGDVTTALALLRDAMRRRELSPPHVDAAGRFLKAHLPTLEDRLLKVQILGQCTTTWLTTTLTAEAWGAGTGLRVADGGYDTLIHDIANLDPTTNIVVLLPWHQRLLGAGPRSASTRVADELDGLRHVWQMIPPHVRLIQIGYDWVHACAQGHHVGGRYHGDVHLVREVNVALREALPDDCYFVDLEQISALLGHHSFYDMRNYAWTKQPFSMEGVCQLSRHVWSGIRALTTGPKKVLVVDLDNTLWGGIVGEAGPLGVELGDSPQGEAFRGFQLFVKQLRERGIVLAACSKNNLADAREPFQVNRDMVLKLEDFSGFEASWDPKPMALQRIAQALNLGLDSFVFFDDNPAEREAVRQQLPMVEVVDAPEDPADYIAALQAGLWFEAVTITDADRERSEQYEAEQQRKTARASIGSLDTYLASLGMQADIREIDEPDLQRIVQLLGKTNQFNLTTRRHTTEDVRALLAQEGSMGLTLRLQDRFGDYGLVSVVLGVRDTAECDRLRLDTWLMSCRAIGRTVEYHFMNRVVAMAGLLGYRHIVGEYVPTAKNVQVATFYPNAGFTPINDTAGGPRRFSLEINAYRECLSYVAPCSRLEQAI